MGSKCCIPIQRKHSLNEETSSIQIKPSSGSFLASSQEIITLNYPHLAQCPKKQNVSDKLQQKFTNETYPESDIDEQDFSDFSTTPKSILKKKKHFTFKNKDQIAMKDSQTKKQVRFEQ